MSAPSVLDAAWAACAAVAVGRTPTSAATPVTSTASLMDECLMFISRSLLDVLCFRTFPTGEIETGGEKTTGLRVEARAVFGCLLRLAPGLVEIDEAADRDRHVT